MIKYSKKIHTKIKQYLVLGKKEKGKKIEVQKDYNALSTLNNIFI